MIFKSKLDLCKWGHFAKVFHTEDFDATHIGLLTYLIWEYFSRKDKQIRGDGAALSNSFRRFKPTGYKTIVLNRTFYVGVEYVNPTLDACSKIEI